MEKRQRFFLLFFFSTLVVVLLTCPEIGAADQATPATTRARRDAREHHRHNGHVKLFVFGDSYVDTGNFEPNNGSWVPPFGRTFPGVPSGRFSDGRVLTDYIADFLGIRTPIAYQQIRAGNGSEQLKSGVNFAHGGTGVVSAISKGPILGKQISQLGQMIRHRFYNQTDLNNSFAVVSASGNDYKYATLQNATALTRKIVKQLKTDLRRIHEELGIPKVGVLLMEPTGCLPESAGPSAMYSSKCNDDYNSIVKHHNKLLKKAVHGLIKELTDDSLKKKNGTKTTPFIILDLFQAFSMALEEHKYHTGSLKYKNPLKPCVTLEHGKYPCASSRVHYRVCKHPELAFFWDCNHPTQNGWNEIYLALQHSLYQFYDTWNNL